MDVIVIAGPTACGKSDLGIKIAHELDTQIVSADSRQVYRHMDIGTGKVPGYSDKSKELSASFSGNTFILNPYISENIEHWLIDIADPCEEFSVAHFQSLSSTILSDIASKGKVPLVVGGTGLYIRSLTEGLVFPDIIVPTSVREQISFMTMEEKIERLLELDPLAGETIELKNPRRVERALELMMSGLSSVSEMRKKSKPPFTFLVLGLKPPQDEMLRRIKQRLDLRLNEGMVEEVENLLNMGVSKERLEFFGLEYRFISRHICGELTFEEMKESLYYAICHFAKRQITWFNKYSDVNWLASADEAMPRIRTFIER